MSDLSIQSESLRAAADRIGEAVDRLDRDLVTFTGDLAGFGEPWGGDDIGMLIGEAYLAIHEMAMACYESNIDELVDYAEGLAGMADDFDEVETVNADLMRSYQPG